MPKDRNAVSRALTGAGLWHTSAEFEACFNLLAVSQPAVQSSSACASSNDGKQAPTREGMVPAQHQSEPADTSRYVSGGFRAVGEEGTPDDQVPAADDNAPAQQQRGPVDTDLDASAGAKGAGDEEMPDASADSQGTEDEDMPDTQDPVARGPWMQTEVGCGAPYPRDSLPSQEAPISTPTTAQQATAAEPRGRITQPAVKQENPCKDGDAQGFQSAFAAVELRRQTSSAALPACKRGHDLVMQMQSTDARECRYRMQKMTPCASARVISAGRRESMPAETEARGTQMSARRLPCSAAPSMQ